MVTIIFYIGRDYSKRASQEILKSLFKITTVTVSSAVSPVGIHNKNLAVHSSTTDL